MNYSELRTATTPGLPVIQVGDIIDLYLELRYQEFVHGETSATDELELIYGILMDLDGKGAGITLLGRSYPAVLVASETMGDDASGRWVDFEYINGTSYRYLGASA